MDYQNSFAVSAAGMDIERLRIDVAAMNLANANTPLDAAGGGYRPLRVIAQAGAGAEGFAARIDPWLRAPVATLMETPEGERKVMDPGHPMADAAGQVRYPAVDTTTEMMTMMGALRSYEANVAAMNAARTMALKALDIGGAQ